MNATKINVLDFCDPDAAGTRYAIAKPKVVGGVLYATDARVAIRVFDPSVYDGPLVEPETRFPKVETVLEGIDGIAEWQPWPDVPVCEACNGNPVKVVRCDTCMGLGSYECPHCLRDLDCEDCDGTGKVEERCEHCPNVAVGNRLVTHKYASKVASLPGVCWAVLTDTPKDKLFFRFDGGDGALMPLDPDEL